MRFLFTNALKINQISLYRALLIKSRAVAEPLSLEGFKTIADGTMNYIRQSPAMKVDREIDGVAASSSKDAPILPSTVSTQQK